MKIFENPEQISHKESFYPALQTIHLRFLPHWIALIFLRVAMRKRFLKVFSQFNFVVNFVWKL